MPDVLEASPLTLVRRRPEDVDEVLEAVRSSFAELQQWMHSAQTMPTREKQREALTEGNIAFDAGTDFGFLFRETATGALVGGGGVHRRVGPGAVELLCYEGVRGRSHHSGMVTAWPRQRGRRPCQSERRRGPRRDDGPKVTCVDLSGKRSDLEERGLELRRRCRTGCAWGSAHRSGPEGAENSSQCSDQGRRVYGRLSLVAVIVDRVTFNAHIIETGTNSYRLRTTKIRSRRKTT